MEFLYVPICLELSSESLVNFTKISKRYQLISSHSFAFCNCKYYIDRSPNYNGLSSVNLTAL